jgi:monofunctional biosynthetic peptidoglycan transglycosylase
MRWALGAALVWLLGVWPPPAWWRHHWPAQTAMMRLEAGRSGVPAEPAGYHPTPLTDMPAVLQRMVIIGEDSRFHTHHGLDFDEIRDALGLEHSAGLGTTMRTIWSRRDRLRGASTITQQLAKNLYLSPSRNPLRKVKEAVTALRFELALPKDRILELYLNVVELGPGVWGMPAASTRYFDVAVNQIGEEQAASLAATLPFPLSSNPAFRSDRMLRRRDLILARYHGADVYVPPGEFLEVLDTVTPPVVVPPIVLPVDTVLPESVKVQLPESIPDTTKSKTDST